MNKEISFIFFVFILISLNKTFAQNLVPNGGFEEIKKYTCYRIQTTDSFEVLSEYIKNWYSPTGGTPEVFFNQGSRDCYSHALSKHAWRHGTEKPFRGKNMGGLLTYSMNSIVPEYREYMMVKLKAPTVPSKKYLVSFALSAGDRSRYRSNNIGIVLTKDSFPYTKLRPVLKYNPIFNVQSVHFKKKGWVQYSDTVTFDSAYNYLIVGNFFRNNSTIINTAIHNSDRKQAFYFIDEVSLLPICLETTFQDSSICHGDSIILKAKSKTFRGWRLKSKPDSIISDSLEYKVRADSNITYLAVAGCDTHEVNVKVENQLLNDTFLSDTAICSGDSTFLNIPYKNIDFQWNDGYDSLNRWISEEGVYELELSNKCAQFNSQMQLSVINPPSIDLGTDRQVCKNKELWLKHEKQKNTNFQWSTGSEADSILIMNEGLYQLIASNRCGTDSGEVKITFLDIPEFSLGEDINVCDYEEFWLKKPIEPQYFQWSTHSPEDSILITESGKYWLRAGNKCGSYTDTVSVTVEECECPVFIPNAFSPNGDGLNDVFEVYVGCEVLSFEMQVFNRWGQEVLHAKSQEELKKLGELDFSFNTQLFYILSIQKIDNTFVYRQGKISILNF